MAATSQNHKWEVVGESEIKMGAEIFRQCGTNSVTSETTVIMLVTLDFTFFAVVDFLILLD